MYAVIRIRGKTHASQPIRDTLDMMHLSYINNCMLMCDDPSHRGMIQKVKDFVTWGEVTKKTVKNLLSTKSDLKGKELQEALDKLMNEEAPLKNFISPPFRLHPPVKGYEGIKRPYQLGGALGYRGKDVNELIERML